MSSCAFARISRLYNPLPFNSAHTFPVWTPFTVLIGVHRFVLPCICLYLFCSLFPISPVAWSIGEPVDTQCVVVSYPFHSPFRYFLLLVCCIVSLFTVSVADFPCRFPTCFPISVFDAEPKRSPARRCCCHVFGGISPPPPCPIPMQDPFRHITGILPPSQL